MANSFKQTQQEALALIQQIEVEITNLDAKLTGSASKIKTMLTAVSGSNTVQDQLKGFNVEMERLNVIVSKQETQIKNLTNARTQLNQKTSEEVVNQRALAKASDLEAKSKSKIVGAYQRLNAQRNIAKKRLQDLIVSQGRNSAQTKKAQQAYDILTNKINKANKATSNFAKGGLGSAVRGFKNLVGAFGIAGATVMFAQFAQSGFKLAKRLDSLNFAMRTIITDSEELAQTQAFLRDITEAYGAEIVTTTERYIKFLTAAKQSNVSMQDTEQIFRSVTKAAGVLGLSTEELNGTYLALEQMLSKGKVTTEELRRQLGERLPGAFGIMADAIGVNTAELDKMLRAGEILSSDALPKFARALEKAYGIENIERVQTLQAETSRLSNAWTNFVRNVTESDGVISKALMSVLGAITSLIESLQLLNQTQAEFNNELINNAFNQQIKNYKELGDEANVYAKIDKKNAEARLARLNKDVYEQKKVLKEFEKYTALQKLIRPDAKNAEKELTRLNNAIATQEGILKAARKQLGLLNEEQKVNTEETKKSSEAKKEIIKAIEGTVDWYKQEISALQNKRDAMSKNNKQYEEFNDEIEKLQKALDRIIGAYEEFVNIIDSANEGTEKSNELLDDLVMGFDSWQRALKDSGEEVDDLSNKVQNFLRSFSAEVLNDAGFSTLNELLTMDDDGNTLFENLIKNAEDAEEKFGVIFTSITEVAQEAFNLMNSQQDAYFENQLFRLEQERDIAIQFAGDSATAREEIERQYEERRRAIQVKQAEAQRDMALFNILINTAQGVVAALTSTPPNVPLSIAVGIIGGLQAGLVANTPIPAFFRGTMNSPEGWAMVDEKRPEIHTDNKGNIKSFGESGANMRYLNKGDKIYSSRETYFQKELGNILEGNDILPYNQMFDMVAPTINLDSGLKKDDFIREIRGMRKDIMSKETSIVNLDKKGFTSSIIKGNGKANKMNNVLRLKGGVV